MIYVSENKAKLCKGDFRPAQFYKGKKKIAGYERASFEGNGTVTLENCYNDRLHNAKIYGNTLQDGEPSPDNPVEMQSVGDLVTEGEHSDEYKIGVIARGKNIYKPTRISATSIYTSSSVAYLSNNYGTTISTTDATKGEFTVTQTQATGSYTTDYLNGYFMIETGESGLVEGKTYTISFDCEVLGSLIGKDNMAIYMNGGTKAVLFYSANGRVSVNFVYSTYSSRDNYIEFRIAGKSLKISNLMITDAGNSTNYEPYREPQTFNIFLDEPLRKVGEYEDYVDFEKGVVVRNTAKKVFNGTENWSLDPTMSKNGFRFIEYVDDYTPASSKSISALSNRVKALKWDALWQNYYKTGNTDLIIGICVVYSSDDGSGKPSSHIKLTPYSTLPTVEEWKAQLAEWYAEGNPFTVLYAKATTEEPTDLPTLLQFKGATVYEINTNISARISGEYKKMEE